MNIPPKVVGAQRLFRWRTACMLVTAFVSISALALTAAPHTRAASSVYVGVSISGVPDSMAALNQYESDLGKHAAIVNFWRDFGSANSTIPAFYLQNLDAHGSVPMVTWLPTNWNGGDQSSYSLAAIAGGAQDSYLRGWAQQLHAYGKPILIRFAHEMNGTWYPQWSGDPAAYIAAWRHIHDLFVQNGATNVQWVWAPNIWYQVSLATDGRAYYPGDGYVDWVRSTATTIRPTAGKALPRCFSTPTRSSRR